MSFETINISDLIDKVIEAVDTLDKCVCGDIDKDKIMSKTNLNLIKQEVLANNLERLNSKNLYIGNNSIKRKNRKQERKKDPKEEKK